MSRWTCTRSRTLVTLCRWLEMDAEAAAAYGSMYQTYTGSGMIVNALARQYACAENSWSS